MKHFHFEKLGSTQDKAFELLVEHEPPFFVTADYHVSPRGRRGRAWHYEQGRSLAFSLACQMPVTGLEGLSLVVGLSLRNYLADENLKLKWPNDLMLNDSKVGGVLIESRSRPSSVADLAIGVGINCFDMSDESYKGIQRNINIDDLMIFLMRDLKDFENFGFSHFHRDFEGVLWKRGEEIDLVVEGELSRVLLKSVDEKGRLVTQDNTKLRLHLNAEIIHES
ncbi:MAG: biotin--[acetyl-CoA-carboxylase] ligase [Deltaproteobacteria bacterium CG11_big_fil_rev_8_21_14_0_20_45_16]|nr:MAG: biotin--[acetyl-CoA-carboxylase] ligase [Deltaproteobacteria bacterium CG11_big_fil_rev_8_21_14_0_20_45_16]